MEHINNILYLVVKSLLILFGLLFTTTVFIYNSFHTTYIYYSLTIYSSIVFHNFKFDYDKYKRSAKYAKIHKR